MNKYLKLFIIALICLFTSGANSQSTIKIRCDEDLMFSHFTEDPVRNKLLADACACMDNQALDSAQFKLQHALDLSYDAYVEFELDKIKVVLSDKNSGVEVVGRNQDAVSENSNVNSQSENLKGQASSSTEQKVIANNSVDNSTSSVPDAASELRTRTDDNTTKSSNELPKSKSDDGQAKLEDSSSAGGENMDRTQPKKNDKEVKASNDKDKITQADVSDLKVKENDSAGLMSNASEPETSDAKPPIVSNPPQSQVSAFEKNNSTNSNERDFTDEELQVFQEKGQQKVRELENYLVKICDKQIPQVQALMDINNALKLFDSENHFVQVSSLSRPDKPKFPVRKYLERVRAFNYDQVTIEWADFQYASKFRKAVDGNYYGFIKFRQRFTAYKDGIVAYTDVTDKIIAVILKPFEMALEGSSNKIFEVYLGDLEVVQTGKE